MIKYLISAILFFFITGCKKGTLNEDYWETREAGAYKFTSATCQIYDNAIMIKDSSINVGNSFILLYTTQSGGWYNNLDLYGDWVPPIFGQGQNFEKVWNMENDDKRLSFTYYVNYVYYPTASITIEEVGKTKQIWHYVTENGTIYTHYTMVLERTTKS